MSAASKIISAAKNTERKIELSISTKAMYRGWRKIIANRLGGNIGEPLTKEQKREVNDFYKPYIKVNPIIHQYYYKNTGCFDKRFIPDNLYYSIIDYYFNDWDQAHFLDNKCLYSQLYSGILQAETIISRVNGIWQNWSRGGVNPKQCSFNEALTILDKHPEVFVKKATDSEGGAGVFPLDDEDGKISEQFSKLAQEINGDIVVQKAIKQHKDIAEISESSVNTIRIVSLLSEDGVKIYSAILRMGISGSKVDNASVGGITCGIDLDTGKLKEYAYYVYYIDGGRCDRHPTSNVVFKGRQIPSFQEAKQLVYNAHIMTPQFRLISWDIAIREDGAPILVEANLHMGSIDFHQLCNGPLFGDDTIKILDEVFGKK